MKKSVISALALATLVGACTSEDFEMVQNAAVPGDVTALDGRAKGELVLNAGRVDLNDETTRVDGSIVDVTGGTAVNWYWRDANDKLGGVVVDYKNSSYDIVDLTNYPNYAITNYPFEPGIDGKAAAADFSTPTAVVSGSYFFYSQYDGQNTERRTISDEIERLQTVGHGREAGLVQIGSSQQNGDGGENFFISPIVDLAVADGSDVATPLSLTSAHAVLHITLDAELEDKYIGEKGLSVHKIVLENQGGSKFYLQNTIDPAELATRQFEAYDALEWNDPIRRAFTLKNNRTMAVIDGDHSLAKDAQEVVLNYLTRKTGKVPVIGTQDNAKTSTDLVYQLEEPFVYTSSDSEMELFVILPTGTYAGAENLDEYNGKTEGALRMTVYTSEGTYDCYLGGKDGITIYRNQKVNVSRTLKIKADETNINLFDPNDGFKIESTEDYEYAIDYINNHYRDFGNASDWKAPVLNFVADPTILVREGYYFPNFRTEYVGEATLKLQVANGSSYVFNPKNTIFSTEEKPTIKIEDATSSISFTNTIPYDGGTQSIELDSKGAVKVDYDINFDLLKCGSMSVAAGKTVDINAEKAGVCGELNMGTKAKVNAAGDLYTKSLVVGSEGAVNVTGTLSNDGMQLNAKAKVNTEDYLGLSGVATLEAGSELNVSGEFDNNANVTIKSEATATLNGTSTNKRSIVVEGKGLLNSTTSFTNNGVLEVKEVQVTTIDDKARGIANFATLTNNKGAEVYAKAGVDLKGTYGALITVATKLVNKGEMFINGELDAEKATTENHGTITLQDNPYARIMLNGASASLTDDAGKGSLVISTPAVYEMFDNFFTGRNKLTGASGVIETTLDQATYDKVLANYIEYADQERALAVINKITVTGALKVKNTELNNVDFVLPADAKLIATEQNLEINSLTANGNSSLENGLDGWPQPMAKVTIADMLNINADFTVANNVKAVLKANYEQLDNSKPYWGALNIYKGTFYNNGTVVGSTNSAFYAAIAAPATLKNNGVIGTYINAYQEDVPDKYWDGEELATINEVITSYVTYLESTQEWVYVGRPWTEAKTDLKKTWNRFISWVEADCGTFESALGNGNEVTVRVTDYTVSDNVKNAVKDGLNKYVDVNGNALLGNDIKDAYTAPILYEVTEDISTDAELKDYIIVRKNYGTFDMTANNIKTIGGIVDNTKGTKKGEFTVNVLESGLATVVGSSKNNDWQ